MASSADIEHEAEAARARLEASLDQLRDNLAPQNLMNEVFGRLKTSSDAPLVQRAESVIRDHPLPAMLMGIGGALWLATGVQKRLGVYATRAAPAASLSGSPSSGGAAAGLEPESIRDTLADVGKSIADSAYQALRARAAAKIDEYTRSATKGINTASEHLLDVVEGSLDKTVHSVASTMHNRPVAFSLIAIAVGAALGGAALASGGDHS